MIEKVLDRHNELKIKKSYYESLFQELVDYFQPGSQNFTSSHVNTPWEELNRSNDVTGRDLVQKLTSHIFGTLINPATKWFTLVPEDVKRELSHDENIALEKMNAKMLKVFNYNHSNFASEAYQYLAGKIIFGTSVMHIVNNLGDDISFKTIPLSQAVVGYDHKGKVDTVSREFKLTAKQCIQHFGEENISKNMITAYEKNPEQEFTIVHCSYPDLDSKKHVEHYIDVDSKHILMERELKTFEFVASFWEKNPGDYLGQGIGALALGRLRALTSCMKEIFKSFEFANNPVKLLSDDGVLIPDILEPGQNIAGALSSMDGQRRIEMWSPTGEPAAGIQLYTVLQQELVKLFFIEDINMPVDKTRRTATEAQFLKEDRVRALIPFVSKIINTFLTPVLETVFNMLKSNGEFNDIPKSLKDVELKFEFLSPLARMLKMEDARATAQFLQLSLPMLQFDPSERHRFNWEEIIKLNREGAGAPQSILNSDEVVNQMKQAEAQQQQQAAQMQNALAASEISKNVGQANKFNGSV